MKAIKAFKVPRVIPGLVVLVDQGVRRGTRASMVLRASAVLLVQVAAVDWKESQVGSVLKGSLGNKASKGLVVFVELRELWATWPL